MAIKNIAGQPVRKENFFERPALIRQFKNKIESGSSILISAPRRVGKNLTLCSMFTTKEWKDSIFIYLIPESVNSENEYFKRILNKIFDAEFLTPMQKISKKTYRSAKDRAERISEIGKTIKFEKESKRIFQDEFIDTIKSIDLEGRRIIFMIDEFSQAIENIIEDEGKRSAIHFLQTNRELRQGPQINQKIQFVYAGSIGLENIVSRLNAVNLVNDLDPLKVTPLNHEEAHQLMQELTENKPFDLSKANRDYILDKIQWNIPFYFQLAVMEISNLLLDDEGETKPGKKRVTKNVIDHAFSRMLEHRNHFEHWEKRLRKAFKKEDYTFAKEVLNLISDKENIESVEIMNLAQKFNIPGSYKDIVNSLVYDGYINNNDDPRIYRFNSPLLKMWWWKNVAH